MKIFRILTILIFTFNIALTQEVTIDKAIDYINKKLQKKYIFELSGSKLVIQFYKDNNIYRQDKININSLDYNKIQYEQVENAIIIRCDDNDDECVTRIIYKNNTKKAFPRSNIIVENMDSTSINNLSKALIYLVRASQEPDYKLYEFFE